MHVGELWRYPVKSLKGERLDEVEIRADGLTGDRVVHVRNGSGRVLTSRTKPLLLALQGSLGNDGEPLIDGGPWHEVFPDDGIADSQLRHRPNGIFAVDGIHG